MSIIDAININYRHFFKSDIMKKYTLLLLSVTVFFYSNKTFSQITFSKRLSFDRIATVLTGVEVIGDYYWANGISSYPEFPYTTNNVIAKFDLEGNLLLHRFLEDTEKSYETWSSGLLQDSDTSMISFGYTFDDSSNAIAIQYNLDGEVTQINEFVNSFYPGVLVQPWSMLKIASGYLFCARSGNDAINSTTTFTHVFMLNNDLEIVWEKAFDFSIVFSEAGLSIVEGSDSTYLVGGKQHNRNLRDNHFIYRTQLIGLDGNGEKMWEWYSPLSELQNGARGVVIALDGGFVIATAIGTEEPVNDESSNMLWDNYIYKLDEDLNKEWGTYFRYGIGGATNHNRFNKMLACNDGSGYVAVGMQNIFYGSEGGNIFDENTYDQAGLLVKISPEGDSLWSRTIIHPNLESFADSHEIYDFEQTPDGGFICVGQAADLLQAVQPQQGWLLKLDEYGCLVPDCHLPNAIDDPIESEQAIVLLYPNPASDILNVFIRPANQYERLYMQIQNEQGQIVRTTDVSPLEATYLLDIQQLSPAIYHCILQNNKGHILQSKPFVKIK